MHKGEMPCICVGDPGRCCWSYMVQLVWHRRRLRRAPFTVTNLIAPCAGVATAFAAPIGGLLFTIEEGASFYSTSIFWRGFLSTGIGVFTLHFLVECAVSRLLAPFVPCTQAVHPGGVAHPSL